MSEQINENGERLSAIDILKDLRKSISGPRGPKNLKKLWKFVKEAETSFEIQSEINASGKALDVVSTLLCSYNGSLGKQDKYIFDILNVMEKNCGISMIRFLPFQFGETAKPYYEELVKIGSLLHQRLSYTDSLKQLDKERLGFSIKTVSQFETLSSAGNDVVYDPRFLLRLFSSMMEVGSDLRSRDFISLGCLGYIFAATSVRNEEVRASAYICLHRFYAHLNQVASDSFETKKLVQQLIRQYKESLSAVNLRIPNIITHYFARASVVLMNPASPIFGRICSLLISRPTIKMGAPILFYQMLESANMENLNGETEFMLDMLSGSLIDSEDFHILNSAGGFKAILSLFYSELSTPVTRKYILMIVNNVAGIQTSISTLVGTLQIQSWIVGNMNCSRTSNWELCFLGRIFYKLYNNLIQEMAQGEIKPEEVEKLEMLGYSLKFCSAKVLERFEIGYDAQFSGGKIENKMDSVRPKDLEELICRPISAQS
uniref:NopRA1 domain-containing protein n=1 Tax=Rhabditophanes sp. KR3021 TaxID=114890 RepID=A0AC35U944_9BILA